MADVQKPSAVPGPGPERVGRLERLLITIVFFHPASLRHQENVEGGILCAAAAILCVCASLPMTGWRMRLSIADNGHRTVGSPSDRIEFRFGW